MNGDNHNRRYTPQPHARSGGDCSLGIARRRRPAGLGRRLADTTPACSNVEVVFARGTNEAPGSGLPVKPSSTHSRPTCRADGRRLRRRLPCVVVLCRRGTGHRRHDKSRRVDRGDVPQHEDCARRLLAGRGGGWIHGDRRRPIRILASPRHHRTDARIGGRSRCRRCPVRHTTAVHPRITGPRSATDRRRRGLYGEDIAAVRPGRSDLLARRSGPGGA